MQPGPAPTTSFTPEVGAPAIATEAIATVPAGPAGNVWATDVGLVALSMDMAGLTGLGPAPEFGLFGVEPADPSTTDLAAAGHADPLALEDSDLPLAVVVAAALLGGVGTWLFRTWLFGTGARP